MHAEITTVNVLEDCPLLEAPVYGLLARMDTIHHCLLLFKISDACPALHFHWHLCNVSIISLETYERLEPCCKRASKDFKVVEDSGVVRTTNPTDNTSEDAKKNFISQGRALVL